MSLRERFFLIVAGVAILFSLYAWFKPQPKIEEPKKPISGELKPVPESKPTGIKKCPEGGIVIVSGPTKTIDNTPEWAKNKETEFPIASGIVAPWEAETHVWTYMNMQTGKSIMLFEQQPIIPKPIQKKSFFEFVNIKELGAFYGYGNNGRVIQLYGQWDIIRTGAINWKAKIETNIEDNKSNAHLLVGGAYQWK